MKIKRLYINNYKSLVDFELLEPNPFSVFVGPNAAGKSNVFEALEFLSMRAILSSYPNLFGDIDQIANLQNTKSDITFRIETESVFPVEIKISGVGSSETNMRFEDHVSLHSPDFQKHLEESKSLFNPSFSRVSLRRADLVKINIPSERKINIDAANLEPVLHRILQDEAKRDEITEWIEYLIPGLKKVEVTKSELSGEYSLQIFEKNLPKHIGKNLISDGTYNILALLTAVYQSDEPQFLCIEEPENGITPYVQRALVKYFRTVCEEKGHYIWLNSHSPTIVNELEPKELILIDKIDGITKAKQLDPNLKLVEMKLDDAWLTNTLGGGLPW